VAAAVEEQGEVAVTDEEEEVVGTVVPEEVNSEAGVAVQDAMALTPAATLTASGTMTCTLAVAEEAVA